MFARLPLAIAAELDAGAINEQRHGPVGAAVGDLHRKPGLTSAKRGVIRLTSCQSLYPWQSKGAHEGAGARQDHGWPDNDVHDRPAVEGLPKCCYTRIGLQPT